MENSLKKKVVKGTIWVFVSQFVTQFFAFIKNIILARVLAPNDFGLFGIALVVLSLYEVFTQTGFEAALIQKKEDIQDYLNTAFIVNIFRGTFLFILLFFSAPLIGIFFENTAIIPIVKAISFTFLINGFVNPGTIYFRKELDFRKQFRWDMSVTLINVIVSLTIVFYLRNVWVLVIAILSSYLVKLTVSYFIHPYRPRFSFKKQYASSLFKFGKWVLGSSILIYLIIQGDDAFVGKILGITMLGFYRMAYRFSNLPATQITHVISRVSFPAYSKLQNDIAKLRESYLRVLQITLFFTIPIGGLIFILADDFTRIFLGEKWIPIIPAMQILCIFGVTRSFGATTGALFHGVGKPEILTKLAIFQLVILVLIIYPLTIRFGIIGTSIAVVIPNLLTQTIAAIYVLKIIKCKPISFTDKIIYPTFFTAVMIFMLYILKILFSNIYIINFISVALFGVVIYLLLNYLFGKISTYDTLKIIRNLLKIDIYK